MMAGEFQILEIEWVKTLWEQARPHPCVHRHVGYLVSDAPEQLELVSGICVSAAGKIQVLNDRKAFFKKSSPLIARTIPIVRGPSEKSRPLVEVKCEDPTGHQQFYSQEEARRLAPNIYSWCGYIVGQDDTYLRIASGLFQYEGLEVVDFELIHVIPMRMIIETRSLSRGGDL